MGAAPGPSRGLETGRSEGWRASVYLSRKQGKMFLSVGVIRGAVAGLSTPGGTRLTSGLVLCVRQDSWSKSYWQTQAATIATPGAVTEHFPAWLISASTTGEGGRGD